MSKNQRALPGVAFTAEYKLSILTDDDDASETGEKGAILVGVGGHPWQVPTPLLAWVSRGRRSSHGRAAAPP